MNIIGYSANLGMLGYHSARIAYFSGVRSSAVIAALEYAPLLQLPWAYQSIRRLAGNSNLSKGNKATHIALHMLRASWSLAPLVSKTLGGRALSPTSPDTLFSAVHLGQMALNIPAIINAGMVVEQSSDNNFKRSVYLNLSATFIEFLTGNPHLFFYSPRLASAAFLFRNFAL